MLEQIGLVDTSAIQVNIIRLVRSQPEPLTVETELGQETGQVGTDGYGGRMIVTMSADGHLLTQADRYEPT